MVATQVETEYHDVIVYFAFIDRSIELPTIHPNRSLSTVVRRSSKGTDLSFHRSVRTTSHHQGIPMPY